MADPYNPTNWYWTADDGRVFSSASQGLVAADDGTYADWLARGNTAQRWPKDDAGAQTDAALQWVFDNAGVAIFVGLAGYAAAARYAKETGGITVGGNRIDTSRDSQAMIANAYQLVTVSGATSIDYKSVSGWVTATADEIKAIALAVGAHVQACFSAERDIASKIAANPPTITTKAQVDAALAAVTT